MVWEYPSSTLIIYFIIHSPSTIQPDEIPVKVLDVSKVLNEVKSDFKGEHEYATPYISHNITWILHH